MNFVRTTGFAACLISSALAAAIPVPNSLDDCKAVALKFDSSCGGTSAIDLDVHRGA